nr:hypothetical protein [Tanacetum cinerariifolium]
SPVSPTSYPLPPLLMPLPIYTPLPTSSFPLPSSIPSTSGSESIPEADIPLRKRARFTSPTSRYEIGESSVTAAARQIRPTLTIAESRRADVKLIGRLRRERRYFRTVATTYAREVSHSRDYCTQITDYCQSREVHTRTLVTQMEALRRDVSTLQRQHIEHAQKDVAPEDGDKNGTKEKDHEHVMRPGMATIASGTGARRLVQASHECSYSEFLKCKPLDFKGTEGVVELTRWFKKMESVFSISNCTASNQVKFATCTLQDDVLTWWNSHVKTTTPEAAYAMTWATLKKKMTGKYCLRGEIKKIETEMRNLKVKGTDVKENQEKDKIGSKPDKNEKRVEVGKSLKQFQLKEDEKPKKTKKEWPKTHTRIKSYASLKKRKGPEMQLLQSSNHRDLFCPLSKVVHPGTSNAI